MTLIILDPTDERVPVERHISRRNGAISGTIGLLDISKPRGNVLLDELERLLLERLARGQGQPLPEADIRQAMSGRSSTDDQVRMLIPG